MNVQTHTARARLALPAALALALAAPGAARAATFTVRNNCSATVYPGIYPAALYQNGGWTLAPGASSTFTVPSGSVGRLWGRTGCDGASPARCTTGSCGGTGLQCAGTTGQPDTSLFEWNIDAGGTDWYDVSYVDAIDNPIGVTVSDAACVSPSVCSASVIGACPADLRAGDVCLSPCTRHGTDQLCCRGAYGTPEACVVSAWPATAQAYVNNVHQYCPNQYAYAYDENAGHALHTCPTGASYTITFCPSGAPPPPPAEPNVALGKVVTASSSEGAGVPPQQAVDGDAGTRWASAFSDPQWIMVDLGATHDVHRVVLRWEAAYGRAFQVQVSPDGAAWTTLYQTTTGAGGVQDLAVNGTGRYVRLYGTARGTAWGYSLWELEVHGTPASTQVANVARGKPATSSSDESAALAAARAVDGDLATRWSSAFTDAQWLRVDLGAVHDLQRVVLRWEAAYGRAFQVQASPDGATWTDLYQTTSGAGGVQDLAVSGAGRYVRMNGTARGTPWGYSLFELEVYGRPR